MSNNKQEVDETSQNKKKIIRRKPNAVNRNIYFSVEDQQNIEEYLLIPPDQIEKRRLFYQTHVFHVFYALADSLVKVYDFRSPLVTREELIADCSCFLYEVIHKWDPGKGKKAFSYFNVVAKNWLILNTRKHFKIFSKQISSDDETAMSKHQRMQFVESSIIDSPDDIIEKGQFKSDILKLLDDMKVKTKNENELRCLHAIETLFVAIDDLDMLSKRAVRIYISEISGLDKPLLVKSLTNIKKIYNNIKHDNNKYDVLFN
jgi:hypothetical protein